jgi:hypothetical protein
MATSKIDIGIEIIKVSLLGWFLYNVFNEASFPSALWKPATALLKAGVIVLAYLAGREFATMHCIPPLS